jgi:hypothetical protein
VENQEKLSDKLVFTSLRNVTSHCILFASELTLSIYSYRLKYQRVSSFFHPLFSFNQSFQSVKGKLFSDNLLRITKKKLYVKRFDSLEIVSSLYVTQSIVESCVRISAYYIWLVFFLGLFISSDCWSYEWDLIVSLTNVSSSFS